MMSLLLLAALTIDTLPETGCPEPRGLAERLRNLGIVIREGDNVHVEFSFVNGARVAEISIPDASPRRIEHEGTDCASLTDATVALLSVLLDERASTPPRALVHVASGKVRATFRAEAGTILSSGIVASLAVGATVGIAWRPSPWISLGIAGDVWPARDHALQGGTVTVAASTAALVACAGPELRTMSLEGCLLGHGGLYSLSARGFPIVYPEHRSLFGGEAAIRTTVTLAKGVGLFARAGVWVPFSPLDVTVRGVDSGFRTTPFGPKGAIGFDLNL